MRAPGLAGDRPNCVFCTLGQWRKSIKKIQNTIKFYKKIYGEWPTWWPLYDERLCMRMTEIYELGRSNRLSYSYLQCILRAHNVTLKRDLDRINHEHKIGTYFQYSPHDIDYTTWSSKRILCTSFFILEWFGIWT